MKIAPFATLVLLASMANSTLADGLLYRLPADGTAAVFDMVVTVERNGQSMELKGTVTLGSAGKAKNDGTDCRWIEMQMDITEGRARQVVSKVLIPEAELRDGGSPFENRVRAWIQTRSNGEPRELQQRDFGPMPAFLAGPLTDSKKLKAVEIESKALGKVKCEGETGTLKYQERVENTATFEIRKHKEAPTGVVSAKMTIKAGGDRPQTVKIDLKLKGVLKDFKTKLPDSK